MPMTDAQLIDALCDAMWKAAKMREAQDHFFRHRDQSRLSEAKRLEGEFDNVIGAVLAAARQYGWRPPE
jgi:hypothetical protein